MERKKFLSISTHYDTYQSLFKSGLIVAPKQVNNKWLYIIGIDISYGTIDWLDYNKFTIVVLSEFQIISVFRNLKGESILNNRLNVKHQSCHQLLHEILLTVKPWERPALLTQYFQVKEIKRYTTDDICKLVDFQLPNIGYKHYDINTGLRFDGEEYDD